MACPVKLFFISLITKSIYRKEMWDCDQYQNKIKEDWLIIEDIHIHKIMHDIIYNTIKDSTGNLIVQAKLSSKRKFWQIMLLDGPMEKSLNIIWPKIKMPKKF